MKRRWFFFLAVFALMVVAISMVSTGGGSLSSLTAPCMEVLRWPLKVGFRTMNGFYVVVKSPTLIEENRKLRRELQGLKSEISQLREALEENERLQGLLSLKVQIPFKTVGARVIGGSPSPFIRSLIIDKGSLAGIEVDDPVLADGSLVGRVVEMTRSTSKVLLVTNADAKVSARVARSRDLGLVTGMVDGRCMMRYLAEEADVRVGDEVVTSGLGPLFPKGLLIGYVEGVGTEEGMPFRYAVIRPAFESRRLEEVLCIVSED